MAIDPSAPARPEEARGVSAIDNEIPAYRAISGTAIASSLLGLLAALCFVDLSFLAAAAGAVVAGVIADRKIRRMPDVLTGRGFAQAGAFLGLMFGLSAFTHERVDAYLRDRKLEKFADEFVRTLNEGDVADVEWYRQRPDYRAGKSPKEIFQEQSTASDHPTRGSFMTEVDQIEKIQARLAHGGRIRRVALEASGYEGLDPYGAVVLEMEGVPPKEFPETNEVLIEVKGVKMGRDTKWWVSEVRLNYRRQSYHPAVKPVDDGHGHGH